MIKLANYDISEQLHESSNSLVYRGIRKKDKLPVVLKVLREEYPSPEKMAWFKREYDVTRQLDIAEVVDVYALENDQHRWVMVLEDFGATSLAQLGLAGQLDIEDFLTLAIKWCDSLARVHARHIMHKDINPANLVLNPETGQVKLIDFGISTVLERENQSFRNPNQLEGTLAYISPEQTGRMNRAMDYRTDFYSLGVSFYELLTGQLPFDHTDPLALVHAHMARQPIPPHEMNANVPPMLSEIVLKLMAKNAEDRYQSAEGLKYDLEQLTGQNRSSISKLGTHDVSSRFQIPQKLYGRTLQINTLLASFERVTCGGKELILVSGYSGVGKSALVDEVHKPITAKRGYFIRGKFDQLQRGTPYTAFTQAFNEFCNHLLTESEAELKAWQTRILSAVGNNGRVLIDVIPNLEQVIGPQPAVSQVGPQEAQNRFKLYFQFFIRALTLPEHPLVIFIDDWQWADRASLNLLELLMADAENQHLLVIAAYRDNEVDATHPFRLTLDALEEAQTSIHTIQVNNLSQVDITALLEDTFGQNREIPALASLIHDKTAGNAFFTHQLLQTLYNENLLRFDPLKRIWHWDTQQIEQQALSDNVVALMTGKLVKLPLATLKVVQLAACIGNRFDLQTLATIYEQSHVTTAADLAAALQQGLIMPLSDEYKLIAHQEVASRQSGFRANIFYRFVHDRVHQAAYLLIPDEQKQTVHLKIGRLLLASVASEGIPALHQAPSSALQAEVFEITNHHNVGTSLIETEAEKVALARLNLLAGQKAINALASQAALTYFQLGIQLLGQKAWSTQYDLTLLLHNNGTRAAYSSREFTQMKALMEQILQEAHSPLECVYVYQIQLSAYASEQNFPAALQSGLMALQQLGIQLPSDPTHQDLLLALQTIKMRLHGKTISDLRQLPQMTARAHIAALQMLAELSGASFVSHPNLFTVIILKMIELSLAYGNSPLSPHAYVFYGIMLCGSLGEIDAGKRFGQLALDLLAESGNRALQCRVPFLYHYFIAHWKEHIRHALKRMLDHYSIGLEVGDLNHSALILSCYAINLLFAGEELAKVEQWSATYAPYLATGTQNFAFNWLSGPWQAILNLMGKTEHRIHLLGPVYHEDQMLPKMQQGNDKIGLFGYHVIKMWLAYLFAEDELAIKHAVCAKNSRMSSAPFLVVGVYDFYDPLIKLDLYHKADEETQQSYQGEISLAVAKLQTAAEHAPMNYLHKWHLLEAERSRVFADESSARKHYEAAIKFAHQNHYLHEEALAYELAGKFYLSLEMPKVAQLYLRDAHYAYERWGATAKMEQLQEHYPFLAQASAPAPAATSVTTTTGSRSISSLDLTSVLKASQAISGEIQLPKLLDNLMNIVLETAGAQKGCLLLLEKGAYEVAVGAGFAKSTPLPRAIINYVVRKQENVVLNDATHEGLFIQDEYMQTKRPKSVLCAPLINQGRLTAILYLENNLTTGAFTPDRLEVLNLLSSQAAISIENATLYNTLEQKVAERTREAEEARTAAEEANRAKSTFLANMSHELRTPLNAILGFSQLMTRSRTLPKEHVENLGIISRSGEHLLTLINNVLDLSKIEAGKTTLNEENFDLYRLLDDLQDMFYLKADDKRLQLIFERRPDVPRYVRTDSVKLRQVLINLLNNAIKFTLEGGVSLRVAAKEALNGTTRLLFEVEDSGAGIASEEIELLFEAFRQTQTGKQAQEGSGLGLSISRQFVRLMGGEMSVQSQACADGGSIRRGTTFKFGIQVTETSASTIKEAQPTRRVIALEPNQPRYRILIVDDKFSTRQLLIQLLNPLGFSLQDASNGKEAIEIWQAWQPHLIWMDMRMPVMDGYEATKRIKETTKGQATAIIALTASTFEEERAVVLSAGCDDFLRKPFRQNDIFELMHKHIGVRFIYDQEEPTLSGTTLTEEEALTPAALSVLPVSLLTPLQEAVDGSDIEMMQQVLAQISEEHPTLATQLSKLADNFEYDQILELLEQSTE